MITLRPCSREQGNVPSILFPPPCVLSSLSREIDFEEHVVFSFSSEQCAVTEGQPSAPDEKEGFQLKEAAHSQSHECLMARGPQIPSILPKNKYIHGTDTKNINHIFLSFLTFS